MTPDPAADPIVLVAGGRRYENWTELRFARGIKQATSELDVAVTNRWSGDYVIQPIAPFTPVQLYLGRDLLLTGYADQYIAEVEPRAHGLRVTARSKTQDLVECQADLASGQFNGYRLDQIARGVCAVFGIEVVTQPGLDLGDPFPDATLERTETAFRFLERLGRLRRVLLTDDPQGRLVLTGCGTAASGGALVEGGNLLKLRGAIDASKRFSTVIVKGQRGIGGAGPGCDNWGGLGGIGTTGAPNQKTVRVQTQQRAVATDPGVPRVRTRVICAEGQLDQAALQERAQWEVAHGLARGTKLDAVVQGWRQPDGRPWRDNEIATVRSDTLGVDDDLLIAKVAFRIDDKGGRVTDMELGPVAAYAPDPAQVRLHRRKGRKKKHGGPDWSGLGAAG